MDNWSISWWRHQMGTFSALLAFCTGNSPVTGEFPSQRPVTRSFEIFFDLRLNKPLSKQSWSWSFETPSRSLWRHCNVTSILRARRIRWHWDGTFVTDNYDFEYICKRGMISEIKYHECAVAIMMCELEACRWNKASQIYPLNNQGPFY